MHASASGGKVLNTKQFEKKRYFKLFTNTCLQSRRREGSVVGHTLPGVRWCARQHVAARVCVQRRATPPRLHLSYIAKNCIQTLACEVEEAHGWVRWRASGGGRPARHTCEGDEGGHRQKCLPPSSIFRFFFHLRLFLAVCDTIRCSPARGLRARERESGSRGGRTKTKQRNQY